MAERNIDLLNFFPDDYFEVAHAPTIHVDMLTYQDLGGKKVNVTIDNNHFIQQRHSEVLGGSLWFEGGADI